MLAKLTVPAVREVRAVAAHSTSRTLATECLLIRRRRRGRPLKSLTVKAYGFGRIEVDLDQPGHTTKMVKMDDVAHVPGLSPNLLSTIKAVEQWGKPLITYFRNEAFLGFPGEELLVFNFCRRKGLFSATGARRIPRQEMALGENLTENGLVGIDSGTALAMRAGVSRDVMEVHRMLAHPSEDITRKTAEMMGIETTDQWGACETCFQAKAKRYAVPKKSDEWASVKRQRFFVDVGGPMKHSSLGGNNYVGIFVEDCTRFKVVKFVKKKSNTTAALLSLIVHIILPNRSCRSRAYGRIMVASSRKNFSANWTGAEPRTSMPRQTRRSTTGWPNVAAALAIKEAVFCSNMMLELGFDKSFGSVPLFIYNTSALHVAGNRIYSSRAKHITLRYFFVLELVDEGKVSIHYVKSEDQPADLGPKHHSKHRHRNLITLISELKA